MQINVLEYFETTLKSKSEDVAVIDSDDSITFSILAHNCKALSHVLLKKTNQMIREPIAVFLPKSINCVVADIGIIYSGNAYMNLDIKTPLARINSIIECIKPQLIITDRAHYAALTSIFSEDCTIIIDELELASSSVSEEEIAETLSMIIDTDPLCIINTSGSTGTPKGVVLNHKSFVDFTDWANAMMEFTQNEIMGCLSPVVFDIYSYELCLMMSRGGRMVLLQDGLAAFPSKILQTLMEQRVTFIFWVPTIMVNIANMGLLDKFSFADLKTVWFAGEVFPTKQFNMWRRTMPNTRFVNMYGPIEITLDCTHYIVKREISDDEPIPIGYAMRNTDILILNDDDQLCKRGEAGELCVRGSSLAMGYYNNSEKTAEAFVQNPLNHSYVELIYRTGDIVFVNDQGEMVFKGRKDTLVKHSGYRVELGEIEHVIINKLKLIENGCALYDFINKEIVFFYENNQKILASEFRKALSIVLPKYMLPTKYIWMQEMPRNTNGKIDRLFLKEQLNG